MDAIIEPAHIPRLGKTNRLKNTICVTNNFDFYTVLGETVPLLPDEKVYTLPDAYWDAIQKSEFLDIKWKIPSSSFTSISYTDEKASEAEMITTAYCFSRHLFGKEFTISDFETMRTSHFYAGYGYTVNAQLPAKEGVGSILFHQRSSVGPEIARLYFTIQTGK